jgi:hypothetical protein
VTLPPPCLHAGTLRQRREFSTLVGQAPYVYPVHHAAYLSHPPFPHYFPYPQQIMMYATPRSAAVHEAGSQPSPTANHSPVLLVQMSSGKRKRKPTGGGQGGDAEGSEDIAGASGLVPNLMASGPRANAQHPLPPDTKKRTKTQRACNSCCSGKIRFVPFCLAAINWDPHHLGCPWPFDAVIFGPWSASAC